MKKKIKKKQTYYTFYEKTDYYKEIPNKDDRKTMQKIKNL